MNRALKDPKNPKQQRPRIDDKLAEKIQRYANRYHNGNFCAAIHDLAERGLQK